ncbi:hypothetical protein ACCQ05_08770 [Xanthomonas sp. NCPPB 3582]|uniref:hypothetical protein n=1 Tax=Xanthomonas sp. NCPPB 3582 TaxID=487557 RepID=UPI0035581928
MTAVAQEPADALRMPVFLWPIYRPVNLAAQSHQTHRTVALSRAIAGAWLHCRRVRLQREIMPLA